MDSWGPSQSETVLIHEGRFDVKLSLRETDFSRFFVEDPTQPYDLRQLYKTPN